MSSTPIIARRTLLQAAIPLAASTLAVGRAAAAPLDGAIDLQPTPRFELSPHLYMQFMEPLGTTDGSVEASWDHMKRAWRPDLVEVTKGLAPPMLRWGGLFSAYYRWREAVGPRERRRPMHNLMWGGVETNQIGTDEFLDFCGLIGAEPLVCVNFESEGDPAWAVDALGEARAGNAREAADWVAYCNTPHHAQRAANGHPVARPVRYWQIGNETSYSKKRFTKPAAIAKTIEFARAMRRSDPTIKLIAWGHSGWAPDMLCEAGDLIDMLAFHHLFDPGAACSDDNFRRDPEASWAALMASAATHERTIVEMREQTGTTPLALTEAHYQIGGRNRGDLNSTWAVGVAFARLQNIHRRHGDVLKIANLGDFCGTRWQTNVVMLPTPRGRAYLMPVGKVAALYRAHGGTESIAASGVPAGLDAVASRTGDRFYLHAVNTSLTENLSASVTIGGARPRSMRLHQITTSDPFAEISSAEDDPMTLSSRRAPPEVAVHFPPASVTVVEAQI
jgi:alpha-L-arabinofuranosidase